MKDDGSCSCWLVAVGASFVGLLMLCTMLNGGLAGNGEWLDTTTDVGVMESYDAIFESNNAVAASSNCDVAADVVDDGGGCIGGGDTDRDIVGHVGSGTELVQDPTPKSLRKLSRRKRFVAFPEGSSFSVCCIYSCIQSKNIFNSVSLLMCKSRPHAGGLLHDRRLHWQSVLHVHKLVDELGRCLRFAQRDVVSRPAARPSAAAATTGDCASASTRFVPAHRNDHRQVSELGF